MDTALWRVECDNAHYALPLFRQNQVETYQRELSAMTLGKQANLPIPTLHATAFWQERPVMLLGWCRGSPVGQILLKQPWRVWSLGKAFGQMQARIHTVPAFTLGM